MRALKTPLALTLCCTLAALPAPVALAAPSGGQVVGGQARINQSGTTTTIDQSSNRAIINWNAFNIGQQEAVIHTMPSADSAGLYRVIGGGGASQIEGLLQSNGNIFLVNPAGVIIHNGARVETGGFLATTSDITDQNFMQGNYLFNQPGQAGAAVVNLGRISVRDSGFAALVAPTVRNDGIIAAKLGKVALASTNSFTLDLYGDDLIAFTTPEQVVDTLHTVDGAPLGVSNSGQIKAEGGIVLLTAQQLDGVVGSVVQNSGMINAASAEMAGGKIVFKGEGEVEVRNTGAIDASSSVADGGTVRLTTDGKVTSSGAITATGANRGGSVVLTGTAVELAGAASIDASGQKGGGTVLAGGNAQGQGPEKNAQTIRVGSEVVIRADALDAGNGGQVVVWSDQYTKFDGAISAKGGANGGNGGWVETSGATLKVGETARVNTSAVNGKFGTWLLDPADIIIGAGGTMTGTTLANTLNDAVSGSNILVQTSATGAGNGDIFVNDPVTWASNTILTLSAYRDVNINANITATGNTAGLVIESFGGTGAFNLALGAEVKLSGLNPSLRIGSHQYTVINSLLALQNMNLDVAGYYALGSNIDASGTGDWFDGAGFMPIGSSSTPFQGIFNGLGHIITDLTINRPSDEDVGLFGDTAPNAIISHVGLVNANIIGDDTVGALVGFNQGTIFNSYSIGAVDGGRWTAVGGLVGDNQGTISNSYSMGTVTSLWKRIDYTETEVEGSEVEAGGLVGRNWGTITKSYSTATVEVGGLAWAGGFVGFNFGAISNSYSTGSVDGDGYVGGFVGVNYGAISNSYSTGAVVDNSYDTNLVGGFAGGGIFEGGNISNCYWDKQTSGLSTSAGGTGLMTADMKKKGSFGTGWNFTTIWYADGQNYPKLRNVGGPGGMTSGNTGGNIGGGLTIEDTRPTDHLAVQDKAYKDYINSNTQAGIAIQVAEEDAQMRAANKLAPDNSDYTIRLNNIMAELLDDLSSEDQQLLGELQLTYKVYIKDLDNLAVATMAIGAIRVESGAMKKFQDNDELYFWIAHEVGHIIMYARGIWDKDKRVNEEMADQYALLLLDRHLQQTDNAGKSVDIAINAMMRLRSDDNEIYHPVTTYVDELFSGDKAHLKTVDRINYIKEFAKWHNL